MSEHLKVHRHLSELRGFAVSLSAEERIWLQRQVSEIERLLRVTYGNFLARGEQLEEANKYAEGLESRLDPSHSEQPKPEATPESIPTGEEPITPMTDLSGEASKVDWQTGMIKPEGTPASVPTGQVHKDDLERVTDLSGPRVWSNLTHPNGGGQVVSGFGGYEPNGAIPETD